MLYTDLETLGIDSRIIAAVGDMGYVSLTPVQEKTIPLVLSRSDLLVQAPTGTGKTAAFAVPIINMLDMSLKAIQAVVLAPTRELVMQITNELRKIGFKIPGLQVLPIYGGQNIERQLAGIRKKPQIIVGTTGRVMDHLNRKTLKLQDAKCIVLDEADEMLDMGFRGDIDFILERMSNDVQSLLFSATMPKEIAEISAKYQKSPLTVKTTCEGEELPPIKQYFLPIMEGNKYEALKQIIREKDYHNVLIFCNTKRKVTELDKKLNGDMYLSMALHGDMRQSARDKVMRAFRAHEINMLIATDVAARGIDVDNIEAIFNYDVPLDPEYYVHRIGRTARANKSGIAYTFATSRDRSNFIECEKAAGGKMEEMSVEGLTLLPHGAERKKATGANTVRFFLNVGTRDGVTPKILTSLLTSETKLEEQDIYDINLRDIYGFVEVSADKADELMSLKGERRFRRVLSIEVADGKGSKRSGTTADRNKPTAQKNVAGKNNSAEVRKSYEQRKSKNTNSANEDKKPRNDSRPRNDSKPYEIKTKDTVIDKPYVRKARTENRANAVDGEKLSPRKTADKLTGNREDRSSDRPYDRKSAQSRRSKSDRQISKTAGAEKTKSRFYIDSREDSNPVNEFYKSKEEFNRSRPKSENKSESKPANRSGNKGRGKRK